jgi:hypothetical protein
MKYIFLLLVAISINVFPQHLPLQIGNQWHYNQGLGTVFPYAAIAVDTLIINNKTYFKIECREANTDTLLWITYDRVDGDSLYFRLLYGSDNLLFNFNWQDSQVVVSPANFDTTCFHIQIIHRDTLTVWGIQTSFYHPEDGYYCPNISPDTGWALSGYSYLKYFGCYNCIDGVLIGALVDGMTYGTLHPLPVELNSFNAIVSGNDVHLVWETSTELNNRGFGLYRKNLNPNSIFELIKFIPGLGTTTEKQSYSFSDKNILGHCVIYKLIQYDFDGTSEVIGNIEVTLNNLPNSFALYQNYPNPFNPSTTINYSNPVPGQVILKIFDVLGREIETLINEFQNEGMHSIKFDASNLTSGIYFYQLKVTDFVSTKKMLVIQ